MRKSRDIDFDAGLATLLSDKPPKEFRGVWREVGEFFHFPFFGQ